MSPTRARKGRTSAARTEGDSPARPLTLLGVPIDSVGEPGGTELGPDALRERLAGAGIPDDGDTRQRLRGGVKDPETGWLDFDQVCELTGEVRERVAQLVRDGRVPVVLGGCCTLVPGALAGARDALGECGIAYLDGHFDLYEGDTSQTGEAADFPLAAAIGRAPQSLLDRTDGSVVDPARIELLGPRDEEEAVGFGSPVPGEVGISHYRDRDSLRGADLATVGADAAERLAEGGRRYWLHLDVDVMDEGAFPATDVMMPDGLSVGELSELIAPLLAHEALAGVNLVCFNPEKDPDGSCGDALAELTLAGLGVGRAA
jgi:arginase